jgi:hypothetical protein
MPFVERDAAGNVVGLYACRQPGFAEEFLADADAEVIAFLDPPPSLMDYASQKRWQVETGGVTVNGTLIRTDAKSQNRISGAALLAINDPDLASIDWEATPGEWVTVDKADMIAIGIAVGRHVQACFSTLRDVQAALAAGTITTTAEVDAAAWPG